MSLSLIMPAEDKNVSSFPYILYSTYQLLLPNPHPPSSKSIIIPTYQPHNPQRQRRRTLMSPTLSTTTIYNSHHISALAHPYILSSHPGPSPSSTPSRKKSLLSGFLPAPTLHDMFFAPETSRAGKHADDIEVHVRPALGARDLEGIVRLSENSENSEV